MESLRASADTLFILLGAIMVACRERRIVRLALRYSSSSFFNTPRAWMNRLR